jgi:hypothetical protein
MPAIHRVRRTAKDSNSQAPQCLGRRSVVRVFVAASSPLSWWRMVKPSDMGPKSYIPVRRALIGTDLPDECNWKAAFSGNAACAIGAAVRQIRKHDIGAREVDLAMSAVLVNALRGDAASAILISWALRKRAAKDEASASLSSLWLVSNF